MNMPSFLCPTTKYLFACQRKRFEYFWSKKLPALCEPRITSYTDVYALPAIPGRFMWGEGGLLTKDRQEIPESWACGVNHSIFMGGSYDFSSKDVPYLKGEYIFLGFIIFNWGHFLMDFAGRLHHLPKNSRFIFLTVKNGISNFHLLPGHVKRFLILLGIDPKNIFFINNIAKIEKVIIPQTAYITDGYLSELYLKIFNKVIKAATPKKAKKIDKIYFSRINFNKAKVSECGLEMLEDFFARNGYTAIYPEREELDDLIFLLNSCKSFAAISGTLIHDLLFCQKSPSKVIIMNKSHFMNQMLIDSCKFRKISPIFIDCFAAKYPVPLGHGPFLFTFNDKFKQFCKDFNMVPPDKSFQSSSYLSHCIAKYENYHSYIEKCTPYKTIQYISPKSDGYFDPYFLESWNRQFANFGGLSSFSSLFC